MLITFRFRQSDNRPQELRVDWPDDFPLPLAGDTVALPHAGAEVVLKVTDRTLSPAHGPAEHRFILTCVPASMPWPPAVTA